MRSFPTRRSVTCFSAVSSGLIMGLAQMALVGFVARVRNFPKGERIPLANVPGTTYRAVPALLMPVILLYCIWGSDDADQPPRYAAYALALAVILYRELSWRQSFEVLVGPARRRVWSPSSSRVR